MSKLHKPRREGDGGGGSKKKEAIKASRINLPYWVLLPPGRSGERALPPRGHREEKVDGKPLQDRIFFLIRQA